MARTATGSCCILINKVRVCCSTGATNERNFQGIRLNRQGKPHHRRRTKMNAKSKGLIIALGFAVALAAGAPSARAQGAAPAPASSGGAAVRAGYLTCHV